MPKTRSQDAEDKSELSKADEQILRASPAPAREQTEEEYVESYLNLRAIVSYKKAGVIIGKVGMNVADLRDETGVRAGGGEVGVQAGE
ncbi:hypothetical protein BU16DRAFT_567414 [Lophium mytilinum]|uniref:K Homology domain-containing protein n=1 Tax=Lophium mytilinum TaxID=390894 RepID=A0A6A6QC57_9PEZI|nr:hypothetical protein BU16DRAFT_567414 [Lophium mytilinum]